LVGLAVVLTTGAAYGQGYLVDQSGTLTASGDTTKSRIEQRFSNSWVALSTYVGTGTFYTSGAHDPYVANVLMLRPAYQLGTKADLAVWARALFEVEYTEPDNQNGKHYYPQDTWLGMSARNLYSGPRSKIRISGTAQLVLPTSYESLYNHTITTVGAGLGALRPFRFGKPDAQGNRWSLVVSLSSRFSKNFQTSETRGSHPGDTTGCRQTGPAGNVGGYSLVGEDRCGGPLNTNFSISSGGGLDLVRGAYSLSISLSVINSFKYHVSPDNVLNSPDASSYSIDTLNTIQTGRSDSTWGMISFSREISSRLSAQIGISSYQPAMSSDYKSLRFPFFDFSGTNANNFTQLFVGVTGTL
jgi:hypothetical protein